MIVRVFFLPPMSAAHLPRPLTVALEKRWHTVNGLYMCDDQASQLRQRSENLL